MASFYPVFPDAVSTLFDATFRNHFNEADQRYLLKLTARFNKDDRTATNTSAHPQLVSVTSALLRANEFHFF